MKHHIRPSLFHLLVAVSLLEPAMLSAQDVLRYQQPPDPIPAILDAPEPAGLSVSPDGRWALESTRRSLPPVAELAVPAVETAGLRLNPVTNGALDESLFNALAVVDLASLERRALMFPDTLRLHDLRWSPDSRHVAWCRVTDAGTELWLTDVTSGNSRRLGDMLLNPAVTSPLQWLPDSQGLLCLRVPAGRSLPPKEGPPLGPVVLENEGRTAASRTYPFLIRDRHDEELLEFYATAELVDVSLTGEQRVVTDAGIALDFNVSPDGRFILLTNAQQPWSRSVPLEDFPQRVVVLDRQGRLVHEVAELPSAEEVSIRFGSVRPGPRSVHWRADQPATLCWVEALDGGDAAVKAAERDVLRVLPAPFTGKVRDVARFQDRFSGLMWGRQELALVWESWYKERRERVWRLNPDSGEKTLLLDRNSDDAFSEPGRPQTTRTAQGRTVLRRSSDGNWIYWSGRGAGPEGVHPFLDRMNVTDGRRERLWECRDPWYEAVDVMLDDEGERLLVSRQSPLEPENKWLLETPDQAANRPRRSEDFQLRKVTQAVDPAPSLAGMQKDVLTYKRADGVDLSATLYLPPGYRRGVDPPLPMVFWVYPREFRSREAAGRVTSSEFTFSRPWGTSVLFLLTQGYAVLADPTLPILGEESAEPNDSYLEQLKAGARAAVEEVARLGVADTARLAIGGHSYGAFTAANLLAHTTLFRTALCFSGAYNRTLTPFGFQGEDRSLWQAPETYLGMSPFLAADRIARPLLLVHGMDDPNPGTFPLQSDRFFEALKGLGATVRLVRLPAEGHGYRARESVGHVLWEMTNWCDTQLKGVSGEATGSAPVSGN